MYCRDIPRDAIDLESLDAVRAGNLPSPPGVVYGIVRRAAIIAVC